MPKNLSGGERSFSTVSLLLALWDTAACPIRCLDEWDVFLDAGNRGVAARMLVSSITLPHNHVSTDVFCVQVEGAKESQGKQFILITPQVISARTSCESRLMTAGSAWFEMRGSRKQIDQAR